MYMTIINKEILNKTNEEMLKEKGLTKLVPNHFSWEEYGVYTYNKIKKHMKGLNKLKKEDFLEWFMERKHFQHQMEDGTFKYNPSFDFTLVYHAYIIQKKLYNDYDNWTIVAGKEGYGKSTLGINFCKWVTPDFDNSKVVISAQQFNEVFRQAKRGDSILLDEGGALLFSRDAMTSDSKFMIKSAMIARAKNVNLVVCIPNFYIIDSYIRDHRVDFLFQITKRGQYRGFLERGVRRLSREGRRWKETMTVRVPFTYWWDGEFSKEIVNTFNYEEYKANKDEYIKSFLYGKEISFAHNEPDADPFVPLGQLRRFFKMGMDASTISTKCRQGKLPAVKFGDRWFIKKSLLDHIKVNGWDETEIAKWKIPSAENPENKVIKQEGY